MGCDIHAHMEILWNGEWLYYAPINIRRDYALFARLANVRNAPVGHPDHINPYSEPKDLPIDVSPMTKIHSDTYGCDGHSHSWITSQEFVLAEEQYMFNKWGDSKYMDLVWLFGNSFTDYFKYRDSFPKELEDFRMVFWFDN